MGRGGLSDALAIMPRGSNMKSFVTGEDVQDTPKGGEIEVTPGAIVTPWARELAATRGIRIVRGRRARNATVVALGSDHGGFWVKEEIKKLLTQCGYRFIDHGTHSTDSVDYPDFAYAVAESVRAGEARLGICVDGAGIGSAMAATKVPGVRAATCHDVAAARNAREHNDANVLSLGAKFISGGRLAEVVETFLTTDCTEDRHLRRVGKITAIEERFTR